MNKITKRDLENFMKEYEREAKSSTRMVGIVMVSALATISVLLWIAS